MFKGINGIINFKIVVHSTIDIKPYKLYDNTCVFDKNIY